MKRPILLALVVLAGCGSVSTEQKSMDASVFFDSSLPDASIHDSGLDIDSKSPDSEVPDAHGLDVGCVPQPEATTCSRRCGEVFDNCGRKVECSAQNGGISCSQFETCGGGGIPNACGCTRHDENATCQGKCGDVVDNCGVKVNCTSANGGVTCTGTGVTCGGGGVANECGCTSEPSSTTCAGKCGVAKNNCGKDVDCGTSQCTGTGETCGGGGVPNKCGCKPQPLSVTCQGRCYSASYCGGNEYEVWRDNCGNPVDCGTNHCSDGQVCCSPCNVCGSGPYCTQQCASYCP
ncbi:MAG: hypothetical protein HY698_13415 [Deltaproteobacteria bacterium]|nr:hypothetical protein [Deltaproteobacteria bacterium]